MQCVGRKRTDNLEDLNSMLQAWEQDRNAKQIGINWQFTAEAPQHNIHIRKSVSFGVPLTEQCIPRPGACRQHLTFRRVHIRHGEVSWWNFL